MNNIYWMFLVIAFAWCMAMVGVYIPVTLMKILELLEENSDDPL